MRELTYSQAISEALVQGMEQDPNVFIFGLGVDDHKGIFGTTRQAFERFGPSRVMDTPACEGALTGIAIGAALNGKRPVLVHARNDFMFLTLDQMINNAAKWKYVYAGKSSVPIVVRGLIGKGWGQGPTHSQSIQSILAHFPGLIVAMPSCPYDIKGIILKSLECDSPVVILEHRSLYNIKGPVPEEKYTTAFGQSKKVREGKDITVAATSYMVEEALKAAQILEKEKINLEIIDPVTLRPFDCEPVLESVRKTGRLIVADTSWLNCGFASEVSATIAEKGFSYLKAPIKRVALPDCPCPVSKPLEDAFYRTSEDIIQAVYEILDLKYRASLVKKESVAEVFTGPY